MDAGRNASLTKALPEHIPIMLQVATSLVGRPDAEDATQEAIVKAWQALATLRDPDALRPWLLRITVNVCRQWQRGGFGRRLRLMEPLPDDNDRLPVAMLADDPGAIHFAARLDLRAAINALDDDLRLIVVLRYYAEMDATEIGHVLEIPAATVRTRLRRALGVLRNVLGDRDDSATTVRLEGDSHGA